MLLFITIMILLILVVLVIYLLSIRGNGALDSETYADTNTEVSTVTTLGRIELIVVDKDNSPVTGSVFNLIDSYNNVLLEVTSQSDGVIDFYSVPVGDYTITQISAPEGYEIKEKSKKVTVIGGELSTIKFEN